MTSTASVLYWCVLIYNEKPDVTTGRFAFDFMEEVEVTSGICLRIAIMDK